jgi:hypothetical protein
MPTMIPCQVYNGFHNLLRSRAVTDSSIGRTEDGLEAWGKIQKNYSVRREPDTNLAKGPKVMKTATERN